MKKVSFRALNRFNDPVLTVPLSTESYVSNPAPPFGQASSIVRVSDVTGSVPNTPFFYTCRYDNEGQTFPISTSAGTLEIVSHSIWHQTRDIPSGGHALKDIWVFLSNNGSLTVLDQFTTPSGIWEGIGTGDRIDIRIKPEYPSGMNIGGTMQLEAHGKEPLVWVVSDEAVGKVDSNGLFTAVGKGTCTVTVIDALGNIATSGVITVQ